MLDLLLDDNRIWTNDEIAELHWLTQKGPEIISTAKDNRVLMRGLEKIIPIVENSLWPDRKDFALFLRKNQDLGFSRMKKNIALAYSVQKTFEETGIKSVAFKTLDNFPDMGRDIDLLIPDKEHFSKAKNVLHNNFRWKPAQRLTFCDTIVGKNFYTDEENYDISVEIYPRHSQLGEEYMSDTDIVNRRVKENIDGYDFYVPAYEDRILIMAIHRIYRHAVLRISDILNISKLTNSHNVNWEKVMHEAQKSGALGGINLFLSTVDNIYEQVVGNHLPIPYLIEGRDIGKKVSIDLTRKKFPSKMPPISTASVLLRKIGADLSKGRGISASRVAIMPILIGITFVTYKLLNKNYLW